MIIGIGGEGEFRLGLLLEKIEHARADIEKSIDRRIVEMIASLVLEIGARRLAAIRYTGVARMPVAGNPEHAAGECGGTAKILIFLNDDHVEPGFPGGDRGG